MEHSTVLISLTLFTLLCGLGIATYQLISTQKAKVEGEHSALAAKFGAKTGRTSLT